MGRKRRVKIYLVPSDRNAVDKWSALVNGEEILEVKHEMSYQTSELDCSCPGYAIKSECKHINLKRGEHPHVLGSEFAFTYARILHQVFSHEGNRTTLVESSKSSGPLGLLQTLAMIIAHPSYSEGVSVYIDKQGEDCVRINLQGRTA